MERANRFIQQWTGREGYSAIPQVDSENPGIQLEEFSLPSERNSELVLKQKAVLKYATIGAILLFGMLGFTALVRIHSRQEMERESLSLYAPCHTECSDPCTSWEVLQAPYISLLSAFMSTCSFSQHPVFPSHLHIMPRLAFLFIFFSGCDAEQERPATLL